MDRNFWDGTKWVEVPREFEVAALAPTSSGFDNAGFWIRAAANLIDTVVLIVPSGLLTLFSLLGGATGPAGTPSSANFALPELGRGLAALLTAVYLVICWSRGATLGMYLLGLRVVNADTGARIGIVRSIVRLVGYVAGAAVCYLGWIWVAFDEYKQGWHDKLANTVVIHAR
jgi:uncharacterized RDD family membrane protein YckC